MENLDEYSSAFDILYDNADLTAIRPLMELFYDDCYETALVRELEELILIIADRYGENGILKVIQSLKYVKDSGEYFGKKALVKMMISGNDEYFRLINIISHISEDERKLLSSILLNLKELNIKGIEERLNNVLRLL